MASVYLWQPQGEFLVGHLARLPGGDQSIFTLDDEYQSLPSAQRPMLSLSFLDVNRRLKQNTRTTNTRIHPWFSNLLPEGHLRQYIAGQYGFHPARDFPLILALGQDLPGAVIVRPDLAERHADGDQYNVDTRESEDGPLKFSLAGVQLKFSAVRESTGGLTIPARGYGGSWIIKLPSEVYQAVPENEFDMMRLAKLAGFDVPEIDLLEMYRIAGLPKGIQREQRAFVIRRFDRTEAGGRIHIEDFAQIFGLYSQDKYKAISYGNIINVINGIMGDAGVREFIARLVFNAAIGNGDMHAKNWSVIYRDGITPELAPPYDYLSTLSYVNKRETMGLSLAGTNRFEDFSLDLMKRFARKVNLSQDVILEASKQAVERTWSAWSILRHETVSPKNILNLIDHQMRTLPIFNEVLGAVFSASTAYQQINTTQPVNATVLTHTDDQLTLLAKAIMDSSPQIMEIEAITNQLKKNGLTDVVKNNIHSLLGRSVKEIERAALSGRISSLNASMESWKNLRQAIELQEPSIKGQDLLQQLSARESQARNVLQKFLPHGGPSGLGF